jgi:hypothetical protein
VYAKGVRALEAARFMTVIAEVAAIPRWALERDVFVAVLAWAGACREALAWVRSFETADYAMQRAWDTCDKGSWLIHLMHNILYIPRVGRVDAAYTEIEARVHDLVQPITMSSPLYAQPVSATYIWCLYPHQRTRLTRQHLWKHPPTLAEVEVFEAGIANLLRGRFTAADILQLVPVSRLRQLAGFREESQRNGAR